MKINFPDSSGRFHFVPQLFALIHFNAKFKMRNGNKTFEYTNTHSLQDSQ